MTKRDLRKKLKGSTIKIRQRLEPCFNSMLWHCTIVLSWKTSEWDSVYFVMKGQANADKGSIDKPGEPYIRGEVKQVPDLYGPARGGYYGMEIETKMHFPRPEYRDNVESNLALGEIVLHEIESRNLRAVYPDCQASQILAAFEYLGAHVEASAIGDHDFDRRTWLQREVNREDEIKARNKVEDENEAQARAQRDADAERN